jgi:serine/threonine-protein kinase
VVGDHTTPIRAFDRTPTPPPPTPPVRRIPPPARPRRSRRGLLLLVAAVLLVAGAGVGAWWFLDGRYTSTPGVLGLSRAAAEQRIEDAGLEVEWGDKAYSETVPAGDVVATDPDPGSKVLDGGTVTVTLSLGKERYDVPALKGMTVDQAQDALADTHLSYGTTTEKWSDTVDEGVVISTSPKAGTTLRPDAAVDLVVSKGPKPVTLKDWVGKDADDALAWAESKGLDGSVASEEYSDTVDEGDVISMDPPAGSTLHRGDAVSFVVSKGPHLIEVPSVRAQGVDAATQELEALGFHVVTDQADGYLGLGFVFSQSPGGGEMVPVGSTITLYLI